MKKKKKRGSTGPTGKNTRILSLYLDKKIYTEFRKLLFKEGIWPQEYLKFVLTGLTVNNSNTIELLNALKREKAIELSKGGNGKGRVNINSENIYDIIEMEFEKEHFGSSKNES